MTNSSKSLIEKIQAQIAIISSQPNLMDTYAYKAAREAYEDCIAIIRQHSAEAQQPEDVVERVARALCIEDSYNPDEIQRWYKGKESIEHLKWHSYQGQAKAAIAAMSPPQPNKEAALKQVRAVLDEYYPDESARLFDIFTGYVLTVYEGVKYTNSPITINPQEQSIQTADDTNVASIPESGENQPNNTSTLIEAINKEALESTDYSYNPEFRCVYQQGLFKARTLVRQYLREQQREISVNIDNMLFWDITNAMKSAANTLGIHDAIIQGMARQVEAMLKQRQPMREVVADPFVVSQIFHNSGDWIIHRPAGNRLAVGQYKDKETAEYFCKRLNDIEGQ